MISAGDHVYETVALYVKKFRGHIPADLYNGVKVSRVITNYSTA